MSLDYYFYVETKKTGEWTVPSKMEEKENLHDRLGKFTWVNGRSNLTQLFFGKDAIFPFHQQLPPDRNFSAIFHHLDKFYDYQLNEQRISWIAYSDLCVDLWNEMKILLKGKIAAKNADLFGNGQQLFPMELLIKRGWNKYDALYLSEGSLTNHFIDRSYGKGYYELSTALPERLISVTWVSSIGTFLGQLRVDSFLHLRQYGSDEELRIISMYS